MRDGRLRKLTTCALMAAIVLVVTWTVRVPIPVSGGAYVNFGDAAIFLCAAIAGGPLAAGAAAVGSGLADLAAGAPLYILPTALIKAAMALLAASFMRRNTMSWYIAGCVAGGAVMTGSYYLFEALFFGPALALASLPFNLIQWGGSVLAAAALYEAARRIMRSAHGRLRG